MFLRRRLEQEEGRLFAGLTLYRGTEEEPSFKAPLWSVEVQFVEEFGLAWFGWGYRSVMWRLPKKLGARLRTRLENPGTSR